MTTNNFYAILDLEPGAIPADVRKAYRKAALRAHPDKGGTEEDFHSVARAFEALSCVAVRAASPHDENPQDDWLHAAAGPAAAAGTNGSRRRPCARSRSSTVKQSHNAGRKSSQSLLFQALGRLQAVLQCMNPRQRRACILGLAAHVRSALLFFMKRSPKFIATGPMTDTTDELPRVRVRKSHVRVGSSTARVAGLRTVKTALRTKYKVQVYANALRLYTSEQTSVETATEHHITLVRLKNAIIAECDASPTFWQNPQRLIRICASIVDESGIPEEKLGVRVFAVIKAGSHLAHDCRITTPVEPLAGALETYCRIRRARATSWDAFRAEWVHLLCSKRFTREAAEAMADGKRKTTLDFRLKQAQRVVERTIARQTRKATASSRAQVGTRKRSRTEKTEVHGSSAKSSCDAHRRGGG